MNGGEKTVAAILPILDDFERAIADKSEDPKAIKEGVQMIFNKFVKTLEGLGVKKIETNDKDFDVDFHEAIAMVPGMGDDKKGKIIDCVQTGYTMNDKVIRHAKVAVGQYRSPWHDYHGKGTYMLTLVVEGRIPLLGKLVGRVNARPGDGDGPKVMLSELGTAIVKEEIPKIHKYYPQVEVWKICIMPDHIHAIVRVKEDLRGGQAMESLGTGARGGHGAALTWETGGAPALEKEGNPALKKEGNPEMEKEKESAQIEMTAKRGKEMDSLGMVVKGFKLGCNRAYWRIFGMAKATRKGLFEPGYNDKLLLHEGQLKGWKKYLDDNPRRLMVKRLNPELFTVMQNKVVAGRRCQMVGNCFLLDIPDKVAVIVHRRYSEGDLARLRKEWLACGERGGVLVSAAISTKEKEWWGRRVLLLPAARARAPARFGAGGTGPRLQTPHSPPRAA